MAPRPPAPRVLYDTPHLLVTHDGATELVRYVRTREPYRSLDELRENHAGAAKLIEVLPAGVVLLLDIREAPPRNDEAFEAEITAALTPWWPRFRRHAVLVKTAMGRLQTQRLERRRSDKSNVFTDEAAALLHLGIAKA